MPDSVDVLQERVNNLARSLEIHTEECRNHQRDLKEQIINVHKRFDRITETLNTLVTHDKSINKIAAHVQSLEEKTKDYELVRDKAKASSDTLGWVTKIVMGGVITALLGLILVKAV